LRRAKRTICNCPPASTTPVETTLNNSEINTSVNTVPNIEQDALREQAEDQSSALSGYSPGRSSEDSDYSSIHTTDWFYRGSPSRETSEEYKDESPSTPIDNNEDNDNSHNPPNDSDKDTNLSTPSPSITTTSKMASFDLDLEYLVRDVMK
jgi:hypothetical protein